VGLTGHTNSPPGGARPGRCGFTLPELLVVIGMVLVLIAFLIPYLGRGRELSTRTLCLSNLRQLGLAFVAYQADNRGHTPRPGCGEMYEDWLYWQTDRNPNAAPFARYVGTVFNAKVYICPKDVLSDHAGANPYSYTINEAICRVNFAVGGSNPGAHGAGLNTVNFASIRNPGDKILFICESSKTIDDATWCQANYNPNAATPVNLLSNRHDIYGEQPTNTTPSAGRGTAAFCDGHAEFIYRTWSVDPSHFVPYLPYP